MRNFLFFISLWLLWAPLQAEKTSVIIPCYYGHVKFLAKLLRSLAEQTVLPEEVVISISEIDRVKPSKILALERGIYPFKLIIIKNKEKLYAGANRNKACAKASGEIFISQDADDLPHQQRVEIIKYLFKKNDIDHLIHRWIPDSTNIRNMERKRKFYNQHLDKQKIQVIHIPEWNRDRLHHLHFGNIAIRRRVFQAIKWSAERQGQDVIFDAAVCKMFKKTALANAYLVIYREQFSSAKDAEKK